MVEPTWATSVPSNSDRVGTGRRGPAPLRRRPRRRHPRLGPPSPARVVTAGLGSQRGRFWSGQETPSCVYAIEGPAEATVLLDAVIAGCASSEVKELPRLGGTPAKWRTEILAPTEAMGCSSRSSSESAAGSPNFENYRLRLLAPVVSNGRLTEPRRCEAASPLWPRSAPYRPTQRLRHGPARTRRPGLLRPGRLTSA